MEVALAHLSDGIAPTLWRIWAILADANPIYGGQAAGAVCSTVSWKLRASIPGCIYENIKELKKKNQILQSVNHILLMLRFPVIQHLDLMGSSCLHLLTLCMSVCMCVCDLFSRHAKLFRTNRAAACVRVCVCVRFVGASISCLHQWCA